jgi:hypothetical protein
MGVGMGGMGGMGMGMRMMGRAAQAQEVDGEVDLEDLLQDLVSSQSAKYCIGMSCSKSSCTIESKCTNNSIDIYTNGKSEHCFCSVLFCHRLRRPRLKTTSATSATSSSARLSPDVM